LDLSIDNVREALLFLCALILSISVHEFGHAWIATKLGDPLPRAQGRLTLSPMRHVDPIGTIVFPLIMFFTHVPLLGWGRPVETNPAAYTRRFSVATGHLFVAIAGPLMNLAMATVVSLLVIVGARAGVLPESLFPDVFRHLIQLNLFLMFFNLLPIPPLDGGAVLAWVLPRSQQYLVDFLNRWGFLILLGMMMVRPVMIVIFTPAQALIGQWARVLFGIAYS
jgi:Zn-dependent protease